MPELAAVEAIGEVANERDGELMPSRGEPAEDGPHRVRLLPGVDEAGVKLLGSHVLRAYDDMLGVEPRPIVAEKPVLFFNARMAGRRGERRVEGIARNIDLKLVDHLHRVVEHVSRVVIQSEDKATLNDHTACMHVRDYALVGVRRIERFLYTKKRASVG